MHTTAHMDAHTLLAKAMQHLPFPLEQFSAPQISLVTTAAAKSFYGPEASMSSNTNSITKSRQWHRHYTGGSWIKLSATRGTALKEDKYS